MAKISVNGVEISYYDSGSGSPVIFLHSFGHNKLMWIGQLTHFENEGYRVIAPDFRGHGESGFDHNNHTIETMAEDILTLLKQLQIKQAVLVGISMGGYVALRLWATHPEVIRALVLSNTKAEADTEEVKTRRLAQIKFIKEKGLEEFVNNYAQRRLAQKTLEKRPWVLDLVKQMNLSMSGEALMSTLTAMMQKPDETRTLNTMDVPTLVTVGSEDSFIPTSSAAVMRDKIRGAKMVSIEHTGHVSSLEDPMRYNEVLGNFLRSVL